MRFMAADQQEQHGVREKGGIFPETKHVRLAFFRNRPAPSMIADDHASGEGSEHAWRLDPLGQEEAAPGDHCGQRDFHQMIAGASGNL